MSAAWLPEIVGNPAGMRDLAGALRGEAFAIAGRASQLEAEVKAMVFEGPAGDEFRAHMSAATAQADAVAQDLVSTANLLETSATQVEAAQRERERRLQELAEAAQRQKGPAP
jgi:uncharacterized protein YukE